MQTPTDTYLDDHTYFALRGAIIERIAKEGEPDPEPEITRLLGEVGGIWPKSVLDNP